MLTIRKGTKAFERVLTNAKDVVVYTLSDGFRGSRLQEGDPNLIAPPVEILRKKLCDHDTKLTSVGNNKYRIHVHSNLWFDFVSE